MWRYRHAPTVPVVPAFMALFEFNSGSHVSAPAGTKAAFRTIATRVEDFPELTGEALEDGDGFHSGKLFKHIVRVQYRPNIVAIIEESHAIVVAKVENFQNVVTRDPG